MRWFLCLTLCLAMVAIASPTFATSSGAASGDTGEPRHFTPALSKSTLTSNSSSLAARETTGPDTFVLYGGPDHPTEGKFQLANGVTPDWGAGNGLPWTGAPGEWTPVDNTDLPVFWHQSTFNAETLNNNGAGNNALWSGVDVGDPLGSSWVHVPGYGNSWNDAALYESAPLGDTSIAQVVALDFFFHHDTEPGFDYFNVQYDSAGTWTSVLALDGSNKDTTNQFQAPGLQFSVASTTPIEYSGNDYGGVNSDQIRIRLLVTSDGAWSDADGLWPTHAGAAQVDDISLTTSQGAFTEDFEAVLVPPARYLFHPDKSPFAGDFAEVYPRITDIDPCRDNGTPVIGMIDYGQIIRNGPGLGGETSIIGGSTSPGINYGIIGNHTVNFNGGLSFGEVSVYNNVQSPDVYWDLSGAADDDVEISGAFIRFTTWMHLPLYNGHFFVWSVRSALAGENYNAWQDRNFVYYGGGVPVWGNIIHDVSDILQAGPERVQMSLGAIDYASVFGFVGSTATPSPCFDNAAFYKYRLGGPTFATRLIDTAQDGFPISGSIDVSTAAARGGLDIPFSMARDVNTGDQFNVPGDTVIVDVVSVIPGAAVADMRMFWALQTNAVFEDALRAAPASVKDENVVAGPAGTMWTGEVTLDTSKTSGGAHILDRYFARLPDVDFMYPGDVLHYYFQASDTDGRTTTLPANIAGFHDFTPTSGYNRAFTVRGLPSIQDAAGAQPGILVWDDSDLRRNTQFEVRRSFGELGYAEGVDYDLYTSQGPGSGVSDGLGSTGAHGANADQLNGYNHVFYFSGGRNTYLLSNGTNSGNNDKGNDIDVMEQWHALAGVRNCAYFGDYIATALINDSAEGLGYITSTMGIDYGDQDVRDVIDDQTAPLVVPNATGAYAASFSTQFIAYGGCLAVNEFDQFQPAIGADAGHLFADPSGVPYPPGGNSALGGVASVINSTTNGVDITFPYSLNLIRNVQARSADLSARTLLFQEILGLFGASSAGLPVVSAPRATRVELSLSPNPLNPNTMVSFSNTFGKKGSVKVFNLRGELVKVLHDGDFTAPEGFSQVWDGKDDRGASVASGVYLIQARADGEVRSKKAALVK